MKDNKNIGVEPKKIDIVSVRQMKKQKLSLAEAQPHLANEWHPEHNGALKPTDVTCGSEKDVWWRCSKCQHEWRTKVLSRGLNGTKCPNCNPKKEPYKFVSLEDEYPDVAKYFHPTKNKDITPKTISYSSDRKIWWTCDQKHEYEASVLSRTKRQGRCPYCSNKELLQGFNDLESKYPNVAKEWHPSKNIGLTDGKGNDISTPDKVVFGARRKVWWIGACGHEYEACIHHRTIANSGCPYCDGKKVLQGFNDLATKYPDVAKEWHPVLNGDLKPTDVVARGQHKPWWLCPKGHSYQAFLGGRTGGSGCPICDGKQILPGYNDLATVYPHLVHELHPTKNNDTTGTKIFAGGNKKIWWLCENGHDYDATVISRVESQTGCPYCCNKKVLIGYNDLVTTHPTIAATWHPTKNGGLKPTDVTYGSGRLVWWQCEHQHFWKAKVLTRAVQGCGCPYCAGSEVWPGFNDLATKFPELALEFHPTKNGKLTANNILAGGNAKVWWLGKCTHEWEMSLTDRCSQGQNCPYCSSRRILVGFNDLATTHPHVVTQWHSTKNGDLKPTDVIAGSRQKVWWICDKQHSWAAAIYNRAYTGNGCPICNESRGEKATRTILLKNNISFKEQYVFNDRRSSFGGLLKDDFAILHKDKVVATIEYHGIQHYEVVDFSGHDPEGAKKKFERCQIRDQEKTDYLNKHHIPQLIIPYWEYDNISTLVQNFISTL